MPQLWRCATKSRATLTELGSAFVAIVRPMLPRPRTVLPPDLQRLFGASSEPVHVVARRADQLFPGQRIIVWEGDPTTFRFSFVSRAAEEVLGYPAARWIEEPTFWADHVVLDSDRQDAIAYCALATAKAADHIFEYRARAMDGRVVWLRDVVHVILGSKGIPVALRGAMFDVSDARRAALPVETPPERLPSVATLRNQPDAA